MAPLVDHPAAPTAPTRRTAHRTWSRLAVAALAAVVSVPLVAAPASARAATGYTAGLNVGTTGQPTAVAVAPDGSFYFGTQPSGGVIYKKVGGGAAAAYVSSGLGTKVNAIAVSNDSSTLYVANAQDSWIYKVTGGGSTVTTIAGTGSTATAAATSGTALGAAVGNPYALAVSPTGDLYYTSGNRILKISTPSAGGSISVVVNSGGTSGSTVSASSASSTQLNAPQGLAVDAQGDLIVADTGNDRVVEITAAGAVSVVAGTGVRRTTNADLPLDAAAAPAATTTINQPRAVAVDAWGRVYVALSNAVARVSGSTIARVAGGGSGAGALALTLNDTAGVAVQPASGPGDTTVRPVFFHDYANGSVYRLDQNAQEPSTPTVTSTAAMGDGQLTVSWTASTDPGSAAITGYKVCDAGDATGTSCRAPVAATATSAVVTGLTNGTPYSFTVRATNAVSPASGAQSGDSDPSSATTSLAPQPLTAITSAATATQATAGYTFSRTFTATGSGVTWSATGLPAGLTIGSSTGVVSGVPTSTGSSSATITATGLNGTATQAVAFSVSSPPPGDLDGAGATSGPVVLPRVAVLRGPGAASPSSAAASARPVVSLGVRSLDLSGGAATGTTASYSSWTPSVCTVTATGVVQLLNTGTCGVRGTPTGGGRTTALTFDVAAPAPAAGRLPSTVRLAGADRVGTSVAAAARLQGDGTAQTVVVASARTFADSLAGGRLASLGGGPLLLTDGGGLDDDVAGQVRRTLAAGGQVYALGREQALSPAVLDALGTAGSAGTVTRVGGDDRYGTAVAIADRITAVTGDVGPIYLTTGRDFADGVTSSALAARTGGVVLLTDGDRLPTATAGYLAAHDPRGDRVVPIGGPAAAAAREAGMAAASDRGLVGADRYATAAAVAAHFRGTGAAVTTVGFSTGTSWPDAVTGSAAMGVLDGPLLLTGAGGGVPAPTLAAVRDMSSGLTRTVAFGGQAAVADGQLDQLNALLPRG